MPDKEGRRSTEVSIRFGTSGVPRSLESGSHLDGVAEVHRLGLGAMELAFVHRVNIKPAQAPEVRELAQRLDIGLSAHASYYINLNSLEPAKIRASRQRLLSAARIGWMCGAECVVFHAGWRHDVSPQDAYGTIRGHVSEIAALLRGGSGYPPAPGDDGQGGPVRRP